MSELILCSSCTRHIRKDEPRCPFCDALVSEEQRAAASAAAVAPGTSRARAYAARVAVIAGSAAFSCSGSTTDTLPLDAGSDAAEDAGDSGGAGTGGISTTGGSNSGGRGGTNSGGTGPGGVGPGGNGNTGNIPLPYGTVWPDDEEF
jgi:hypothetical protein